MDRLAALSEFAAACASRPTASLAVPDRFTFAVSLDPELAIQAEAAHGLTAAGPGILTKPAERWSRDAQPALQAAMHAALQPLLTAQGELELDTRETMEHADPERVAALRRFFAKWVSG